MRFYVLFLTIFSINCDDRIKIINGGYEGLVIAINKDLKPENGLKIYDNLLNLLRLSSEFLYNATDQRAYFKYVTIIIPNSWTFNNVKDIPSCYSDSHIRIGKTDPVTGDEPYTLQADECGQPGRYIHLSENFLINWNKTVEEFGRPEKQFIHEWAHFRYGVFDEYGLRGSDVYPQFYPEGGKIHPTSCIKNISGWLGKTDKDGSPIKCEIYPDGTIDYECDFIADNKTDAKGSLMFLPYLNSTNNFCDSNSQLKIHNKNAPTMHNSKCGGRSTWDVIMMNDDFKDKPKIAKPAEFLPNITLRKFKGINREKYVLLLDISGSMKGNRIDSLNLAVNSFIDDIPDGNSIGIVTFSTEAQTVLSLTKILNEDNRNAIKLKVPTNVGGHTAIGKGLLESINLLNKTEGGSEGSTIILVTDGEENVLPIIKGVMDDVIKSNVRVMCMALGPDASEELESLTTLTGGKMDRVTDSQEAAVKIKSAFATFASCDDEDETISVFNKLIDFKGENTELTIPIDEQIGKNTLIALSAEDIGSKLYVDIIAPDGKMYSCRDPPFNLVDDNACKLKLASAPKGPYNITIHSNKAINHIQINVKVTSEVKDKNDPPITVLAWLSKIVINHLIDQPTINVQVLKGGYPVTGAEVKATVEFPYDEEPITISVMELKDNIGFYNAKFAKVTSDGRYSVSAEVGHNNNTKVVIENKKSFGPKKPRSFDKIRTQPPKDSFDIKDFTFNPIKPEKQIEYQNISAFVRTKNIGSFKISNYTNEDVIPPEQVTDLKVNQLLGDEHIVYISFTASGDNSTEGLVKEIDLRVSNNKESLLDDVNFNQQTRITHDMIQSGDDKPLLSGTRQEMSVKLPEKFWLANSDGKGGDIYFALRSIDSAGNKAKISNIAYVHFGYDIFKPNELKVNISGSHLEISNILSLNQHLTTQSFILPDLFGIMTEWKISSNFINLLNISLISPESIVYYEDGKFCTKDYPNNSIMFHFFKAVSGVWDLHIESKTPFLNRVSVVKVLLTSSKVVT